jgi:hypothetical protein
VIGATLPHAVKMASSLNTSWQLHVYMQFEGNTVNKKDTTLANGDVAINPTRLAARLTTMKARVTASLLTPSGIARLRDSVEDEELEKIEANEVTDLVIQEFCDEVLRPEVRRQLLAGLAGLTV